MALVDEESEWLLLAENLLTGAGGFDFCGMLLIDELRRSGVVWLGSLLALVSWPLLSGAVISLGVAAVIMMIVCMWV